MLEVSHLVISSCTTLCRHIEHQVDEMLPMIQTSGSNIKDLKYELESLIAYFISPPPMFPPYQPLPPGCPQTPSHPPLLPLQAINQYTTTKDHLFVFVLAVSVCFFLFCCSLCDSRRPKSILY